MKYEFTGLDTQAVEESRKKHGSNELAPPEVESFWDKLLDNFKDPIIIILCVALLITVLLTFTGHTEWYESVGIAMAVILATFISTFSEYKNEESFQKLQEEASRIKNNVFRNGHISEIFVSEIVVGDYVLLQAGDKIPADGRIIAGDVKVNQASLTGESVSVKKVTAPKEYTPKEDDFSDPYLVFRGSVIDDGEAVMFVDSVGEKTFYGKLAKELSISEDRESPLQLKLTVLAGNISKFGYTGATFIFFAFMFKKILIDHHFAGNELMAYFAFSNLPEVLKHVVDALILAIIIVVAAVPEGLPMMIAIVLSLNMRKLLNAKVLVRKLLGIETSGSLNILFSDKTGTITKGQLEASLFLSGDSNDYKGFDSIPEKLANILAFAIKENSACVIEPSGQAIGGNISERALLQYLDKETLLKKNNVDVISTILFNSARKFSATQIKGDDLPFENGTNHTLIKGAAEILLQNCQHYFDENGQKQKLDKLELLNGKIDELSKVGIRVLALAISDEPINQETEHLPTECTLVGVIGIKDEIREESKQSIQEAQKAGIQVVMITGDKKETAISISREVGLLTSDDDVVLTSAELKELSDDQIKELIPRLRVVSRALPTDKSRLVRLAQELGLVVGMTGDGVNDSAALKKADVGFAMGSGSEVAKEAGDIVILDDNFSSITRAILYGRTIFRSIRKFVVFQLTVNVAAVLTAFFGPFFGFDFPLTIIQLLWINLIMDTLAALAFGGEPALKRYMDVPPTKREEHIITKDMGSSILTSGIFVATFSLFFLTYEPIRKLFECTPVLKNTELSLPFLSAFFSLFIFLIMFNAFNARTDKLNLFEHISENKGFLKIIGGIFVTQIVFTYLGGTILRTYPLTINEWGWVFLMAILIIPLDLGRKFIRDTLLAKK